MWYILYPGYITGKNMKTITKISLVMFLAAALLIQTFTGVPAYASAKDPAYKAYYSLIKELHQSDEYSNGYDRFALIYVDNDDIPELLAVDTPSDEYDNNGLYIYELYTYYDGKAVMLGAYQSGVASAGGYRGDTKYIKKSGKLLETYHYAANGEGEDIVYKMQDGQMIETNRGAFNIADEDTAVWNGKTMSVTDYSKKLGKAFKEKKAKSFEAVKTTTYKKMRKKLK